MKLYVAKNRNAKIVIGGSESPPVWDESHGRFSGWLWQHEVPKDYPNTGSLLCCSLYEFHINRAVEIFTRPFTRA